MDLIIISVIIGLALIVYFTVKFDGFQDKPATAPVFIPISVIKDMETYATRVMEENKDTSDKRIIKLQNHIQRLRNIIDKHEGGDDTITYKITMIEVFHIHTLVDDIVGSK
jgi:hypothetical protein